MDDVINGLKHMFLKLEVVSPEKYENSVIIFAIGCGIIGIIAIILDFFFFLLSQKSLLKLNYTTTNLLIFIPIWGLGAMLMGFLGQLVSIFQVSLVSCLLVGFLWPTILTKLFEQLKQMQESQEPEQVLTDEE